MRDVLRSLGHSGGPELDFDASFWLTRLAPEIGGAPRGPLKRCGDALARRSAHRYHARAFWDGDRTPAWDRISELQGKLGRVMESAPHKELEQKFKILFSAAQAATDFGDWTADGLRRDFPVAILFVDIDKFKSLNSQYGETVVDENLLPEFQRLLREMVRHRGCAYREGGEEFVIALPNQTLSDGAAFARRLRAKVAHRMFGVASSVVTMTVSIGVAAFPDHGQDFAKVRQIANFAEHRAKKAGGNCVVVADAPEPV
ncbi:MAG TPA: GGDEF domain-containing protein [Vicinamibacterales bacterium]|nr:GGDEF domain-containing protein [Vicinamibacterales bacterium]